MYSVSPKSNVHVYNVDKLGWGEAYSVDLIDLI